MRHRRQCRAYFESTHARAYTASYVVSWRSSGLTSRHPIEAGNVHASVRPTSKHGCDDDWVNEMMTTELACNNNRAISRVRAATAAHCACFLFSVDFYYLIKQHEMREPPVRARACVCVCVCVCEHRY